jgi:hypothetical protein
LSRISVGGNDFSHAEHHTDGRKPLSGMRRRAGQASGPEEADASQERLRELESAIAAANRRIDELTADVTVLTGLLTGVLRLSTHTDLSRGGD